MSPLPAALETSRPIGKRNEGARTFWYGPPISFQFPGRAGLTHRLRRAQRGYRLRCLYLLEQAQEVLAEIKAVLATSPSVALDREAPFGGEGRGSELPL
eukprot:2298444-Pleurochrysis_carterae.AAC.1